MILGSEIKQVRKHLKMSQADFADAFCIAVGTVRDWEQNVRTPPTASIFLVRLICRFPNEMLRMAIKLHKESGKEKAETKK